jgi:hypothetical protein
MHPDGSGLSQVTSDTSLAGDRALTALISGSGNRIAFISDTDPLGTNPERRPRGFAVDRDGQNLVQLGNLPLDSWSPAPLLTISDDGSRLLRNYQAPVQGWVPAPRTISQIIGHRSLATGFPHMESHASPMPSPSASD